jgi:hypothetical protein
MLNDESRRMPTTPPSIQHSAFIIQHFLRYVILRHEGIAEPHFDLMFETLPGSALATWRSLSWPIEGPTPLHRLKDHRGIYLDFEGELSGHRGRVRRVAAGECEVEIGENAVWAIRLLTGSSPGDTLTLEWKTGGSWEARP